MAHAKKYLSRTIICNNFFGGGLIEFCTEMVDDNVIY